MCQRIMSSSDFDTEDEIYMPSLLAQARRPPLRAYAIALEEELASGKTFPHPDPALVAFFRRADARDPNADMKSYLRKLELSSLPDSESLRRSDEQRERAKMSLVEIPKRKIEEE